MLLGFLLTLFLYFILHYHLFFRKYSENNIRILLQTYSFTSGSSKLKAQHKVLCYRDERKICFIYQKKKHISQKSSGGGGGWGREVRKGDFSVENLGLFFQT